MKLKISIILSSIILLLSCNRDEQETQIIDQVLKMYVKNSSGQDLLNSKIEGSFSSVTLLDLLNETSLATISGASFPKDADTIVYMDYPAGAVRLLKDTVTSNPDEKIYYSNFIIRYFRTVDSQSVLDSQDTIKIEYSWTPSLFQISRLWYNKNLAFTKVQGQPNIVTIVK